MAVRQDDALDHKSEIFEDHRIGVARKRREKMRMRLLEAVRAHYSVGPENSNMIISDVAAAAGSSRATFYKYFRSLDEAVAVLGVLLSDQMAEEIAPLSASIDDPLDCAAIGIQSFLWRGQMDPRWAIFVSRRAGVDEQGFALLNRESRDISDGRKAGQFAFERLDAAIDVNNGIVLQCIAVLARGVEDPGGYIAAVTKMVLRGLGARSEAAAVAQLFGHKILHERGPTIFTWWRPISP